MSQEVFLFTLRLISASLLLSLLFTIAFILWRDMRSITQSANVTRRIYGKLVSLVQVDNMYAPTGDTYPLRPLTHFGRSPTNNIVLKDDFASSEHATIALKDGRWWLEDRRSRNGTILNGELLTSAVIITDGDIISIGQSHFKVSLDK